MKADQHRWNEKYESETYPTDPSGLLKRFFRRAKCGRALDLACGNGRNSLFLARQGFTVDAVDISDAGLRLMSKLPEKLNLICTDLDTFEIPPDRFNLIVNFRFLNRRLFPYILEGLTDGGVLIFETYLEEKGQKSGKHTYRDYLLRPTELLHVVLPLRILYYAEKKETGGDSVASLVGIRRH